MKKQFVGKIDLIYNKFKLCKKLNTLIAYNKAQEELRDIYTALDVLVDLDIMGVKMYNDLISYCEKIDSNIYDEFKGLND